MPYINYIIDIILVLVIIFIMIHLYASIYKNEKFTDKIIKTEPKKKQNKIISKNCNRDPMSMDYFCRKKKVRFTDKKYDEINDETYVDDYLMKSLIDKSRTIDTKKIYTRSDIDKYRNGFLSFNNKINQSSHNEDPVDKMNELIIEEDGNITNKYQDMPVKDLYNYLTRKID